MSGSTALRSPHPWRIHYDDLGFDSMRIDSHQHFWHYSPVNHAWMSDDMGALKHDYLPADLQPLLSQSGFDGCVAVQASQTLEETRWLLELARQNDFIKGVVGWVDLRSDNLLAQLKEFATHPKFVGVRHVVQDEPDDQFLLGKEFRRGITHLREFNLVYDLLLFPKHLPVAARLVQEFPDQPFVLDHIAKPRIGEGFLSPWCDDLKTLAQFENVACKLSGMVTEAKWKQWQASDFRPYLDCVFSAFGAERLMIGSDWPVCIVSSEYGETMRIVTDYLKEFPEPVRTGILGGNCARIYGIHDSHGHG